MEEATIKKESAKFNEVNRIYDDIASSLKGKLKNIEKIINEAENTDSPTLKKDLLRACVMGAYLKRYSNMTLLSKTTEVGSDLIPAGELQLAIRESLEYLCLGGGKLAKVFLSCEGERLKVSTGLKLYEIFECFVEELVMSDCTLMADINKDASGNIILKLNVGIDDGDDKEAFTEACARIKVEYGMSVEFGDEDSDKVYITILGGGEVTHEYNNDNADRMYRPCSASFLHDVSYGLCA
ncbi:MAG: hypothetical protein K6A38_04115 [Lachnospiraceae bacterium]|nr:hypothetical protein [Lachnospiraceae bacterium]